MHFPDNVFHSIYKYRHLHWFLSESICDKLTAFLVSIALSLPSIFLNLFSEYLFVFFQALHCPLSPKVLYITQCLYIVTSQDQCILC